MIDVENYFTGFKPQFDEDKFKALMKNTPTNFMTSEGNVNASKEFVKSVLLACRLLWQEFDRNNIYYGGEGGGKSHTAFQHTYVWWWCLNEIGMINYEFGMHLIYGKVKHLIKSMDEYKDIPFVLYTLDESEELNRRNWNKPIVKEFMGKLRRERKNLRVVNMIMPALEEMLPAIVLSRINWIFEIDVRLDRNMKAVRGQYRMFNIPVSTGYYSVMQQRQITRIEIKQYLNSRFFNTDQKFENLPKKLLCFRGKTNSTFPFVKKEYKDWARKINAEKDDDEDAADDKVKILTIQRDKAIYDLHKNYAIKQSTLAKVFKLSTSGIQKIVSKTTTTITSK